MARGGLVGRDPSPSGLALLGRLQARMTLERPELDVLGVMLLMVVGCLASVGVMLAGSFADLFRRSGSDDTLLFLARGVASEGESLLDESAIGRLVATLSSAGLPGLSYDEQILLSISSPGSTDQGFLSLRGVSNPSTSMGPAFSIVDGRPLDAQRNELLVGSALARAMPSLQVGSEVELGKSSWRVVGVFQMQGDVRENEALGDLGRVQRAFGAGDLVSSVRVAGASDGDRQRMLQIVDGHLDLEVSIEPESSYFERRSQGASDQLWRMHGMVLALLIPACLLGVLSIQRVQHLRMRRELRILEEIGFQPRSIRASLWLRSVLVGALAGGSAALVLACTVVGRGVELDLGMQMVSFTFGSAGLGYAVAILVPCGLSAAAAGLASPDLGEREHAS